MSPTSRCCWGPRSADATTKCPPRWPTRWRPRCPVVAPPPRPARPGWTCALESRVSSGFGCHRHRCRSALHGRRRQPVQPSPWRPDRATGFGGVDGMNAVAVNDSPRPDRELELSDALTALRGRLGAAAKRPGANSTKSSCCLSPNSSRSPMWRFCRDSDAGVRRIARPGSGGQGRRTRAVLTPGRSSAWHMVGKIQRNKARSMARWAYAAHSVRRRPPGRRSRRRRSPARRGTVTAPSRCGSTFRSAWTATCPAAASTCPTCSRGRTVRAGRGIRTRGTVGLMGIPPMNC